MHPLPLPLPLCLLPLPSNLTSESGHQTSLESLKTAHRSLPRFSVCAAMCLVSTCCLCAVALSCVYASVLCRVVCTCPCLSTVCAVSCLYMLVPEHSLCCVASVHARAQTGGSGVAEDPQNCTQHGPWQADNTNASRWMDEEGSVNDGRLARCLARCINRNYVSFCKTATIQWFANSRPHQHTTLFHHTRQWWAPSTGATTWFWGCGRHLVSSFYDYLPWSRCGVAVADTPVGGATAVFSPAFRCVPTITAFHHLSPPFTAALLFPIAVVWRVRDHICDLGDRSHHPVRPGRLVRAPHIIDYHRTRWL